MLKTKEKVLETATLMFNQEGTSSVSTNHIASRLGISTGNLYYHFKNKEEIIRSIFEKMVQEWDIVWQVPSSDWQPNLVDLKAIIRQTFQLQLKYQFFYRELIVLMKIDPLLKDRHQKIQAQRMTEQKRFFQHFINGDVLRLPHDEAIIDTLLTISWMINNYWLAFLETNNEDISADKIEQGIQLIMTVLEPYINRDGGIT
ncbi:TetR/AcrR family transcriptional regulator [Oceanobacillus manasiensis]|uniref:TetR/AcrR family transcriptional regulator n=1 Tax=Oceanobacillus manasiensis TaxID=586413 RepID=UPI0005A77C82|nr:TetR/AcrR family transcriptional regulator [Oceanobacillus manasiensis]